MAYAILDHQAENAKPQPIVEKKQRARTKPTQNKVEKVEQTKPHKIKKEKRLIKNQFIITLKKM